MKILLREVMIEKDITYQELAKRSGVSKSTLHRIVCGQMYTPIEYCLLYTSPSPRDRG